jgi:predicted nucleic acid-binding protein
MDGSDSHHAIFARLFADPPRLCTSPLVIAEGHGWFLRRFDRTRALEFLALVDALTPLVVVPVGPKEMAAGGLLLRRFADQALTLADAVGLHLARARKCKTCWSTDRHLRLAGTPLVIDGI